MNVCFCSVRFIFFIPGQEIGLGNVSEMIILCRVGHKTLTQSTEVDLTYCPVGETTGAHLMVSRTSINPTGYLQHLGLFQMSCIAVASEPWTFCLQSGIVTVQIYLNYV